MGRPGSATASLLLGARTTAAMACVAAFAIATPVHARAPAPEADVGMFHLDGAASDAATQLERALHRELIARDLTATEIASLSELRLTMGCEQLEVGCLGRGGRALGLGRMVVGEVTATGGDLSVHLVLVDVGDGKRKAQSLTETTDTIAAAELDATNIDATAARLVDGLFPGSAMVAAPVVAPTISQPLPAEPDDDDDARPTPTRPPAWQRVGFGVSAGVAGVFGLVSIAMLVHVATRGRNQLLEAVDASTADESAANDIFRDAPDLCAAARFSPMDDGKVRNATVTRVCNRNEKTSEAALGTGVVALAGLAGTVVFGALLIRWKVKHGRRVVVAPMHGPRSLVGATISGRF